MATGKKISDLPILENITGNESVLLVHNGVNYRLKLNTLTSIINRQTLDIDKVNNTSDKNKPLSDASKIALGNKSNTNHTHNSSQIENIVVSGRMIW